MLTQHDDGITSAVSRPPLGLRPRFIVESQRIQEILEACARYSSAKYAIPQEWLDELVMLNGRIPTLSEHTKNTFEVEMIVAKGLGFVSKDMHQKTKTEIGSIALDAIFTPIRRVSYEVENMRVGDRTDHNRLRVTIETDGTITPHEALESSIHTMITQLQSVVGFREQIIESAKEEVVVITKETAESLDTTDATKVKIEDLNLSTRTENALVSASVRTAGGLARKSEEDLLSTDGLGEKGITEIKK